MAQTVHPGIRAKLVSATSLMRTWPMAYGYTDMPKLMKTLVDVDFRGNLIADHVPPMSGGRQSSWSYSMGCIRALYNFSRESKGALSWPAGWTKTTKRTGSRRYCSFPCTLH